MAGGSRSASGVQSIERAAELLQIIRDSGGQIGLTELSTAAGMPVGTVHRLLQTLVHCGLVRQSAERRYGLGPALIALGEAAKPQLGEQATPFLVDLRDAIGETVNFAILDRHQIVYLAQAPSRHVVRMFTEVGSTVTAHCTAVGKALLAQLPPPVARDLVARTGMPKLTDRTIVDLDQLAAELARIRRRGHAIDEQEHETGVRCVAVAVGLHPVPSGISISGPTGRMTAKVVEQAVPRLKEAAAGLAAVVAGAG